MNVRMRIFVGIVAVLSGFIFTSNSEAGYQWVGGKLVGNYNNAGTISSGGKSPVFTPVGATPTNTGNPKSLTTSSTGTPGNFMSKVQNTNPQDRQVSGGDFVSGTDKTGQPNMVSDPLGKNQQISGFNSFPVEKGPTIGSTLDVLPSTGGQSVNPDRGLASVPPIVDPSNADLGDDANGYFKINGELGDQIMQGQVRSEDSGMALDMLQAMDGIGGDTSRSFIEDKDISIVFADLKTASGNEGCKGYWSPQYNTILIDKSLIGDSGAQAGVIAHEGKHAQQTYALFPEGFPTSSEFDDKFTLSVDHEFEAYKSQYAIDSIVNPDSQVVYMFDHYSDDEVKSLIKKAYDEQYDIQLK